MSGKGVPRSPKEATRFTSTPPHAATKPKARFPPNKAPAGPRKPVAPAPAPAPTGRPAAQPASRPTKAPATPGETPEQRVARLRAAHDAAKNMKVSRFDSIIDGSRRFFNAAHKITVIGLVGLTAVAGVATVYTFIDMTRFNRQRKEEFLALQAKMLADSFEAARLAYIRGDASDEQIAMVEEANARVESGEGGFKLPSILGPPSAIKAEPREGEKLQTGATWPAEETPAAKQAATSGGLWSWFSGGAKKEEQTAGSATPEPKPALTLEEKSALIKEKARAAFEKEQENQRTGGPLDRVGTEGDVDFTPTKDAEPKKKGWW